MNSHTQAYQRLLESISHYSKKALGILESGAGDLPQWTNDVVSKTRTHMEDVTHFLRGQARHGVRYGGDPHGRAYMATKNLREISNYADESLATMSKGAGHFPAWVENKISVCAEYMDLIGHWLENEAVEGRKYGSYLNPVPGDAGDEALYRGRADGITGKRRNPYSPNSFQHKIYEQGFEEGYGGKPRGYGARGGGGRGAGGRGGGRGAGGGRPGPRGGPGGRGRPGGHPPRGRPPGGGPGMGRGRGRRRRHRRHGVHLYPYWNLPYDVYLPASLPTVTQIQTRIDGKVAIIVLHGYGFASLLNDFGIGWSYPGLPEGGQMVTAAYKDDRRIELRIKFPEGVPSGMKVEKIFGIAPYSPMPIPLTDSFFMVSGRSFSSTFRPAAMEWMAPHNRMVEPSRMNQLQRMLAHQTGRRFGVPGIPAGMPGWAGNAGVAQIPHPSRGGAAPVERTFGPGLSAGQGGVQTFPTGGPMAVQTYGSLGYASMGDGSMDMAVRGARRYAGSKRKRRRRSKTGRSR